MFRRSLAVIPISLVLSLSLLVGSAGAASISDPDDTSGKLDISRVTAIRLHNGDAKITIKTYGTWHKGAVAHAGSHFTLLIDTNSDGVADVVGTITTNGTNGLHIEYTGSAGGPWPVDHPDQHTAVIVLEHGTPAAIRRTFHVAAASRFISGGSCSTPCNDRAPNHGGLTVPAA